MKTLAIIPARGGSKRLPCKNIRPFLGTPLIAWSIRFARTVPQFDALVVSTDSEEIATVCRAEGLPVRWLRPEALASDTASTIDVVLHVIATEAAAGRHYDTVALLQPTSPIRLHQRWDEGFARLKHPELDAVIGVAPVSTHPYQTFGLAAAGDLTPLFDRETLKLRGQELPPVVAVAGNLYLCRIRALNDFGTFFPPQSAGVLCDAPFETTDIDTELDWLIAETIATKYGIQP